MSDIQAAVGVAQFYKLEMLLKDRKRCADYYIEYLQNIDELLLPISSEGFEHTYQSFVILLCSGDKEKRNQIMMKMQSNGIQTRPGTIAISRTEFNKRKYDLKQGQYPIAEFCEDMSITLPIYPFMTEEVLQSVIRLCHEVSFK